MSIEEMEMKNYDAGITASQEAFPNYPRFSYLVGMEDQAMQIKDLLIGRSYHRQAILICGMPGLGKTTIAKNIYTDPHILHHFDKYAWCSVYGIDQMRNVLIEILSSLRGLNRETLQQMEDHYLKVDIYKSLKGRKYLIVIDGVWTVNVLYGIKHLFPDDDNGSRILFTGQSEYVVLEAFSAHIHFLRFMNDDECWRLLQFKVFDSEHACPPELEDVGKKIATSCFGLPLAVVKVAEFLRDMPRIETLWMEIVENINAYISGETNPIMELSYNRLPVHLRPCFLYFAIFERGREIPVQKLLMLWEAKGFIGKEEHKSSEHFAKEYLMDLIDRSMVLIAKRGSNGRVKSCTIHPIMYDMCLRIAQRENFAKVIKDRLSIYEQHHRLSIHSHSIPTFSRPFGLHVCSLLGHLPNPSAFLFGNLGRSKVLDLSTIDLSLYNLPESELFGVLKFLSVSSIPSSIEIFKNLEFLFVDNKEVVKIPAIVLNMVKLRHVHFSGNAQFSESWHLDVPQEERFQISYVQNISSLFIYDENDEKILRFFPHLRMLKGRFTVFWDSSENVYRYPALNFLEQLESLNISFLPSYASDDIIPQSLSLPSSLKKLTLRNFDLSRMHMKTVAELPNLEVLKLRNDTIEGKQWDTSEDEFTRLRYLELDSIQIEHWNMCDDSFPILQTLVLVRCQIFEIPSSLGDSLTLQKIEVHGCPESVKTSALQIREQQEAYGNDELKVIISNF